jgi:hypothetical protein
VASKNLIVGSIIATAVVGVVAVAAITLSGNGRTPGPRHNPDTASKGSGPILTVNTPEPTESPTVTPEPTPKPINVFMPQFERRAIAGTTFVIDPDLATVTECPSPKFINQKDQCEQLHEIIPNYSEIPNIE